MIFNQYKQEQNGMQGGKGPLSNAPTPCTDINLLQVIELAFSIFINNDFPKTIIWTEIKYGTIIIQLKCGCFTEHLSVFLKILALPKIYKE